MMKITFHLNQSKKIMRTSPPNKKKRCQIFWLMMMRRKMIVLLFQLKSLNSKLKNKSLLCLLLIRLISHINKFKNRIKIKINNYFKMMMKRTRIFQWVKLQKLNNSNKMCSHLKFKLRIKWAIYLTMMIMKRMNRLSQSSYNKSLFNNNNKSNNKKNLLWMKQKVKPTQNKTRLQIRNCKINHKMLIGHLWKN